MAALFLSLPYPPPSLAPRRPQSLAIPGILVPGGDLIARTLTISPAAPAERHGHYSLPILQNHRRCCTSSSSSTQETLPSTRIFIKGLSTTTSEGFLAKMFSRFGQVRRVKIVTSKTSKQSLGLAYVWFTCEEDAHSAVKEMDGKFVDGRFVFVTIAKPESPTTRVRAKPYRV